MADAADIQGQAFKNGSAILLARVLGADAAPIVQADLDSAKYSIYRLDRQDPDSRAPVSGHDDAELNVAELIFDELQTDDLWTVDQTGYNFRHTVDVSQDQAFANVGLYLVEFELNPDSGQVILVRFQLNVI